MPMIERRARHLAPVTALAASAEHIVSVDTSGAIAVASRGAEARGPVELGPGIGEITAVAVAPEGIVIGCDDMGVRVVDPSSLTIREVRRGHMAAVAGVLATPRGVVTWGADGRLRGPGWQARGHDFRWRAANAVALAGDRLITADGAGIVRLYDLDGRLTATAAGPRGLRVLGGARPLFHAPSTSEVLTLVDGALEPLPGARGRWVAADARRVVTVSDEGEVVVHDDATARTLPARVSTPLALLTVRGDRAFAAGADGRCAVVDLVTGTIVERHDRWGEVTAAAWLDDDTLAVGHACGVVAIARLDARTLAASTAEAPRAALARTRHERLADGDFLFDTIASPAGFLLGFRGHERAEDDPLSRIELRAPDDGRLLARFPRDGARYGYHYGYVYPDGGTRVLACGRAASWLLDATTLAPIAELPPVLSMQRGSMSGELGALPIAGDDAEARVLLFDVETGRRLRELPAPGLYALWFRDGLLVLDGIGTRLIDPRTGELVAKSDRRDPDALFARLGRSSADDVATAARAALALGNHEPRVVLSPDGALAIVSGYRRAWMWDVARREALWRCNLFRHWSVGAHFLPDGRVVTWQNVTGDGEVDDVFVFDARSGELHFAVRGHHQVLVEHDRWLITARNPRPPSTDACWAWVTDLATGEPLGRIDGHHAYLRDVVVSPDGNILTACNDGLLQLHRITR